MCECCEVQVAEKGGFLCMECVIKIEYTIDSVELSEGNEEGQVTRL